MSNLGLGDNATVGTLYSENIKVKNKITYDAPANAIDIEGEGIGVNIDIGYQAGNSSSVNCVNVGQTCGSSASSTGSVNIGIACGDIVGQGDSCVAIGNNAGHDNQATGGSSIAIGYNAANKNQGSQAVAIGARAGDTDQKDYAVAIGAATGQTAQGENSICIGRGAGGTICHDRCTMLNASGTTMSSTATDSFLVNPIRQAPNPAGGVAGTLWWDSTSNEVFVEGP